MKYIKKFEKALEFDTFKNGSEWITPNVSYVTETSKCNFQPYVKPKPKVLNQGTIVVTMVDDRLSEGYIQWQYPVASHVAVFIDNNHVYTTPGSIKSIETVIGDCDPIVINILTDEGLSEINEDNTYIYQVKKSLFPLYLTSTHRSEPSSGPFVIEELYWTVELDNSELYDTLFEQLTPRKDGTQFYDVPEEFLMQNLIYIDGHQVNYVSTETNAKPTYGMSLLFNTVDNWPLNDYSFGDYHCWIIPNKVEIYVGIDGLGEDSNTFTFNIDFSNFGTDEIKEFQAEHGMTWEQWVNSEYNTLGFYICMDDVAYNGHPIGGEKDYVNKNLIINKDEYYFVSWGDMLEPMEPI